MRLSSQSSSPVAAPEYANGPGTPPLTASPRSSPPPQADPHGGIQRLTALGGGMARQLREAYAARPPVPPKIPGVNAPPESPTIRMSTAAPLVPPKRPGDNAPPYLPPVPPKIPGVNAPPPERPRFRMREAPPPVPPMLPGVNAPPPERPRFRMREAPPPVPPMLPGVNAPPLEAPSGGRQGGSKLQRSNARHGSRVNSAPPAPVAAPAAELSDQEALHQASALKIDCLDDPDVARMLLADYRPKPLSADFEAFVAAATQAPRPRPARSASAPVASTRAPMAPSVSRQHVAGLGFNTLRVPADGDCLHHALHGRALALNEVRDSRAFVAGQMRPDERVDYGVEMRQSLAQSKVYSENPEFNARHADGLMQRIKAKPFDAYVALQRVPGMHGGLPELQAWSGARRQNVTVLDHGSQSAIRIENGEIVAQRPLAEAARWPAAKTLFFKDQHWEPVDAGSLRAGG